MLAMCDRTINDADDTMVVGLRTKAATDTLDIVELCASLDVRVEEQKRRADREGKDNADRCWR